MTEDPARTNPRLGRGLGVGLLVVLAVGLAIAVGWALSLQARVDQLSSGSPTGIPTASEVPSTAPTTDGSPDSTAEPSALPTGPTELDGAVWYPAPQASAFALVAASNSSAENRERADYVVDGTAEDEINAALAELGAIGGGQVMLLEGSYELDAPIRIEHDGLALVGVNVGNGAGYSDAALGSQIVPSDAFPADGFLVTTTPEAYGPMISLIHLDGLDRASGMNVESRRPTVTLNAVTQAAGVGIRFAGESTGNRPYDGFVLFNRVFDGGGIGILNDTRSGDMLIEGNMVFRNDGDGFRCLGASQMYRVNHAYNNGGVGLRIIPGCVRTRLSSNKWEGNISGGISIEGGSGFTIVGDTFAHNEGNQSELPAHIELGVRGDSDTIGVMMWGLSFGKGSDDNPNLVHVGSRAREIHLGPIHSARGATGDPVRVDAGGEIQYYEAIPDLVYE